MEAGAAGPRRGDPAVSHEAVAEQATAARGDLSGLEQVAVRGFLAGTKVSLAVRKLRLIRPGVAVADLDTRVSGLPTADSGPGGEVRISQMLVLVEEGGRWQITAQHNAMQPTS